MAITKNQSLPKNIGNILLLVLANILLMTIFGFLMLNVDATGTSRVGGVLLSFFVPAFIVLLSPKMSALERTIKFGSGMFFYIVLGLAVADHSGLYASGLIPCLTFAIGVLYFGETLMKKFR